MKFPASRTAKRLVTGIAASAMLLAAPATMAQNPNGAGIDEYDREMLTSLIEAVIATDEGDIITTAGIGDAAEAPASSASATEDLLAAPAATGPVDLAPVPKKRAQPSAEIAALPDAPRVDKFALQLASYGSPENAQRGFEAANQRYSAALATHTLYVQPIDLGARGVFHRLRIGGFETISEATAACQSLGIATADCMIVSASKQ